MEGIVVVIGVCVSLSVICVATIAAYRRTPDLPVNADAEAESEASPPGPGLTARPALVEIGTGQRRDRRSRLAARLDALIEQSREYASAERSLNASSTAGATEKIHVIGGSNSKTQAVHRRAGRRKLSRHEVEPFRLR